MYKDSSRTTYIELQKIVESLGQKTFTKKSQSAPTSSHVVWESFKKNYPSSSKNRLQHIQLSDAAGTSNGAGFYGQMTQKMSFSATNTQYGFGEHRDKKYIMCTMKYTASCLDTWHHRFYQIPTDKNQ